MPSTESSTTPSTPQNQATPKEEVQRSLRLRDGVRRLGHLEAISSLGDSLEWEAESVKFQTAIDQAAVTNGEFPGPTHNTDADMTKTLIAGDVHNYYRPAAETPAPQTPAPPVSGTLAKLAGPALLAAALLGGGGGGVALYSYLNPGTDTDTNTEYKFDISGKSGTGITTE